VPERHLDLQPGETKWDALRRIVDGLVKSAEDPAASLALAVRAGAYQRVRTVMNALDAQEAAEDGVVSR
jgi:hypothetical protein